jgi:hypothetical protein
MDFPENPGMEVKSAAVRLKSWFNRIIELKYIENDKFGI